MSSISGNHNNLVSKSKGVTITETQEKAAETVPYIVYESSLAREERHVKRLVIALLATIAALFLTNTGWLWFMSQYEFTEENVELTADSGNANYIGENGDIYNGESED